MTPAAVPLSWPANPLCSNANRHTHHVSDQLAPRNHTSSYSATPAETVFDCVTAVSEGLASGPNDSNVITDCTQFNYLSADNK